MFLRTVKLVITKALQDLILAALVKATPDPILDITAKVQLYKAGPEPTENSVIGDYTLSTYTGYAAVTLASVLGPFNMDGVQRGVHKEIDFLCTTLTDPAESAFGLLITNSGGTTLYAAEAFETPVPMYKAGDALSYDLIMGPPSQWPGV